MSRKPIWKQLPGKYLERKSLQRAIRSLRRCTKSMTAEERDGEEWALTLQWANDNGYFLTSAMRHPARACAC